MPYNAERQSRYQFYNIFGMTWPGMDPTPILTHCTGGRRFTEYQSSSEAQNLHKVKTESR